MSQTGQTHFKNLAGFAARFLKCVWPYWNIMHLRVKTYTYKITALMETFWMKFLGKVY